jgi:hypothetical protein
MARQLDLDPEVEASLNSYIETEITNHKAERGKLEDRWIKEQTDFWAEPSADPSDTPLVGFASIIVPLTAIAVEAIQARDMGQMFGLKEFVAVDVADEYTKAKPGLEKAFNNEFLNVIKVRQKLESPILQINKHGTGVAQTVYREVKTSYIKTQDGKELRVPVYRQKGTDIDGIDINDFMMPLYSMSIENAPWVGHRFRVSEYQIKQMVASGYLAPDAYEKLNAYYKNAAEGSTDPFTLNKREQTDTTPVYPSEVVLYRLLLDWDTDGNEEEETSIEVIWHELSRQIVSIRYHEDRDYDHGVYAPLEYSWYGYGIAKQNHEFQVEVTTQHRQRLDNATIANMAMFKVKRSAASYIRDDEPIFPGKRWIVEDMGDIEPMFIGDVKASAYNNENQVVIYSQQRTGVNELTLGMPNVGTPGTASDSLARVQESNRKFDYYYNNKKEFVNKILRRASLLTIQYGFSQKDVYEYLPNSNEVELFMRLGHEKLQNQLLFNIQLAGAKNNKLLDRQSYTQLTGMVTQYWTQYMALAQQVGDPAIIQEVAKKALTSADVVMLEILRSFDVPNPEKLIFNFDAYRPQAVPQAPLGLDPTGLAQPSPSNATPGSSITSVIAPGARIEAANVNANGGFPPSGLSLAG